VDATTMDGTPKYTTAAVDDGTTQPATTIPRSVATTIPRSVDAATTIHRSVDAATTIPWSVDAAYSPCDSGSTT